MNHEARTRLAPFCHLALWLFAALPGSPVPAAEGALRPVDLRCEYRSSPLGIDERAPRLSWALQSRQRDARAQFQTAYQILVASDLKGLGADKGDLWDTGKVASDQSVHVPYAGRTLESHMRCWWKVRAWDEKGNAGSWSGPALWSMGILEPSGGRASWIGLDSGAEESRESASVAAASWIWFPEGEPAASAPVGTRYFRRSLDLSEAVPLGKALFSLTADNDFTLYVNGKKAGSGASFGQLFDFDVTGLLRPGRNVLAASCKNAGDAPNPAGLIGLLWVELSGRDPIALSTDGSWRSSEKEEPGWEGTELDDSAWKPARVLGAYGLAPWGKVGKPDVPRLPARLLRREFELTGKVARATAYVCGLGLFELELNGSKTSSVLPLAFGMVGQEHRGRVFQRLVNKIETEGTGHIGTGLLGAQWLMRLLSDGGRPDLAYGMAVKTDYPSWGYMIEKGATTIWEIWNGDTADPAMNSGNHVMLVGDLLTWLHEYVAGIRPDPEKPGFKHIIVRPHPLGDLTDASATRRSLYGAASVAWKIRGGNFTLELQVPPNTSATLHLPARYSAHVSLPATAAGQAPGFKSLGMKDGEAVYQVGSGSYEFSSANPREVEKIDGDSP
jgi:hypothetical protein